jgi:transposase
MTDQRRWYAGVDWASESHYVFLTDGDGRKIGEKAFKHGGQGLADMADWLTTASTAETRQIHVAIEVPHGPVVETLLERGFAVYAINPKQMDRFRDRFSPAGAKDDSRDAKVMASALRTDPHCLRALTVADPVVIELREWSRLAEDLGGERNRLTNRLREQLWRYFPAILALDDDLGAAWLLEVWEAGPTPKKAARLRQATIAKILARHRIRRWTPEKVLAELRQPPLQVAAGTQTAACAHIETLVPLLRLVNRQLREARRQIDALTARIDPPQENDQKSDQKNDQKNDLENEPGQRKQRDVEILSSLPGVGTTVLATLLTEATDPLQRRDYAAVRSLAGVAPVTKRSGKSCLVIRRQACHARLANALYHWARVATQHDPTSRAKYAALRSRGHSHGRALRSVADRLLNVACAMLRAGTLFNPAFAAKKIA